MAGDDIPAPALGYRFDLRVDEVEVGVFTKIDGLGAEYETKKVKEGGENGFIHELRGRMKYRNVKLTRPVDTDSGTLAAWFTHTNDYLNPQRSTATVAAYDGTGAEVARWDFQGVYPVKYTGPSFAAGSSNVLTESLELAHTGFTMEAGSGRADVPESGGGGGGGSGGLGAGPAPGPTGTPSAPSPPSPPDVPDTPSIPGF